MIGSPHEGIARGWQIAASAVMLLVTAPIACAVALAIPLLSPGPILFYHSRVGKDGKPFRLLKFRTMRAEQSGPEITARADPRITPFGRLLRKAKLDELPQLWNVLRGDMSLVGPRPEAAPYVDLSDPLWREVLRVRPGITDPVTLLLRNEEELLASVPGDREWFYRRYLVPYKLRGYREYAAVRTALRDVQVLWLTLLGVIFPERLPPPTLRDICSPGGSIWPLKYPSSARTSAIQKSPR